MNDINEVKAFFEKDRFATKNGMYIVELGDKYAKCALKITDDHKNALGALMGGVSYTLADFAFAVASNWKEQGTVSLNTNMAYLSPVKGEMLFAEARMQKDGRTTCYYNIDIYDELGTKVANAVTTGFHCK